MLIVIHGDIVTRKGKGRPGWCWICATFDKIVRRHQVERPVRPRVTQTNLEPKEPMEELEDSLHR